MMGFVRVDRQPARHGAHHQEMLWAEFQCDLKQGIHPKGEGARHPLFRQRTIARGGLDDGISGKLAGIFRKADRNRHV
jgi:hypothetical protein